ncbi:MAG: efflux RND transporter periplasmic adaptor subunit [Bacteroidota bacterium]
MKPKFNISKKDIKYSIILILIGLFLGWLIFGGGDNAPGVREFGMEHQHEDVEKAVIWTCSMHPQIKQEKPGQCPICGMDLVQLEGGSEEETPLLLQMTEAAMKIAEVQTTIVDKTAPFKEIYFTGKIKADERLIYSQTAHLPGRIEKLYINFTGEKVRKGQKLVSIYSSGLITAQEELFEAIKHKVTNPTMLKAVRNKFKLWKINEEQIKAIEDSGKVLTEIDILSDYSGVVMKRMVTLGDHVNEGSVLFEVVNLNHIWVLFDTYESDIPWVKQGDKIQVTIQSLPGRSFTSIVTFIDPVINPQTRVAYVRTELNNPKELLKPGMFVRGLLKTMLPGVENALVIPKSAVLWTGKRAVVYVKDPKRSKPVFQYREIVLGEDAGNYYIVKEGLSEGEEIVTNGVFKIDAASQLQGKASMMNPGGGKVSTGHDHGSMDRGEIKTLKEITRAEDINREFKKQLTNVFKVYLNMKEAFVASDHGKVKVTSSKVKSSLKKADMKLVKGDDHLKWMEHLEMMNKYLDMISTQDVISEQRIHFASFNDMLYKSLKFFGVTDEVVYYQFCPMAFNNKGAYWLSDSKEIRNPYFGEKMLKCGETKDIIK